MSLLNLLFKYKDKRSPDKLGFYPEKIHTPALPERRYLWTSRTLAVFAIMSICINIALASVVYVLPAQKTSFPSFFSINEEKGSLDKTNPAFVNISYMDLLTEAHIYEYINMRHSIPISTADLYYRWDDTSKFYWYSTPNTYYEFVNKLNTLSIKCISKQYKI